jgi:hypothetical protein
LKSGLPTPHPDLLKVRRLLRRLGRRDLCRCTFLPSVCKRGYRPPSTESVWLVIKGFDTRESTASATSSGVPSCPTVARLASCCCASLSLGNVERRTTLDKRWRNSVYRSAVRREWGSPGPCEADESSLRSRVVRSYQPTSESYNRGDEDYPVLSPLSHTGCKSFSKK